MEAQMHSSSFTPPWLTRDIRATCTKPCISTATTRAIFANSYVEYYSYGLNNGLDADLAQVLRYNSSFTLALYAAMDIYIHYDGWSMEQIGDYLETILGISDPEVTSEVYYQIVDNPVNYLEYYVGYMEIMDMREQAEETLGNDFSALEFNRFLLDIGPAPFRVIKPYFNEWLVQQQA